MLRLGSCFRQFHSLHPSIAPPGCRRRPVAWTIASIQQSKPLIICKSSYKVQTHNRLLKQTSPSKYSRLDNRMRDLVNIASMGSSSTLAANASPKKPEKAANRASSTGQSVVGSTDEVYQEAIRKLNTLQSNAKTLDEIRKNRDMGAYKNIPDVIDGATRVGISLERLDELSCIHVAGTKGKGSVCAFTESILRASGFKTGFYSSPHLVEVRERIRINGQPLPKEDFAKNFFTVYNRLEATKEDYDGKMPAYFRFLTLLAFHTFLEEKVDVAIMEVGIGGEYDCTNIIRKPVVVGITSLGIDHIGVLGNTIDKIAWHKAGIIKSGRPAFTVPQPENSIQVIKERAREKEASLQVVPSLMSYGFHGDDVSLGLAGMHQYMNATLALQLAKTWVTEERPGKIDFEDDDDEPSSKHPRIADTLPVTDEVLNTGDVTEAQPFTVPKQFIKGLTSCYWPGRNQIIRRKNITYYLDGAHTPRSIKACCKWFNRRAEMDARDLEGPVAKVLIFNTTGERDEYSLLPKLVESGFHGVVFCPNIISLYSHEASADTTNHTTTTEKQMKRCEKNLEAFQHLLKQLQRDVYSSELPTAAHGDYSRIEVAQASGSLHQQTVQYTPTNVVDQPSSTCNQSGDRTLTRNLDGTGSDQFVDAKLVKLSSMTDALQWAACCKDSNLSSPSLHDPTPSNHATSANHIQVLITGSLHLVGGVIGILDPELASRPDPE
ncbi:folylpolyglutamate synthase, mitochondrial [Strongylocentrotus purpuratus]|uniref:tetrahydrofolate synthase n=1 Tax=Strongylocentrotus purpuratus TaxID=7668 RepID=A0A7M7HNC2_STRPU|nr:folylpolyglutamate synthase, mitochondrial [Strongylocentrotus purpuratus]XP_796835.3 folylpolyglutamate synthase, mitochondrial [Strongylocentrotus purpuratus]|eukprot:XP_011676566.1 PREDICTED: folylpolyglutamate synthase, mitochondrial [Strongylocentrotus purpuratus]